MMLLLLPLLLGCPPEPEPPPPNPRVLIASKNPQDRLFGFFLMDRAAMRVNLDALLRMAAEDPDEEVRREVIRQLGYTRDPRVIGLLEDMLTSEMAEEAAESLGYLGPEGCEVLARRWIEAKRDSRGTPVDMRFWRAQSFAFGITHRECARQLCVYEDRYPEEVKALIKPDSCARWPLENMASRPP